MKGSGLENPAFEMELKGEPKKDQNENQTPKILLDDCSDLDEDEERCGFGCFSPEWIQPYATKKMFLLVFSLLGVIQGMTWSYFSATISTLEKRFKISSETSGIVMTGNEISQILFSLLISHFGAKGHRPRWIASGVLISAISYFVLASPHLFFGSGQDLLSLTEEYSHINQGSNASSIFGHVKKGKVNICTRSLNQDSEDCAKEEMMLTPLILIFISQFVSGIGVLLFFTLGGPYMDDNTKRTDIPIVFGLTMSLRLIGPTIGYGIAAGTLKLFINPLLTPTITPDDPLWVGAWWLGWIIFGTAMALSSFFIALFPRTLKRKNGKKPAVESDSEGLETVPKLSEIPSAVKALLKNKINLFNNMAGVFYLFSAMGYGTYMTKYMETIFMQTASSSSMITGGVTILSQSTGMILSGFLISRFRFTARQLAGWNVFTAMLDVAKKLVLIHIGCTIGKVSFGTELGDGTWDLTAPCNQDCNCKVSKIQPVCHKENNTVYYSACHAGCTVFDNGVIGDCSCIQDPNFPDPTVVLGNCAEGCTQIFMAFLALNAIVRFIDSTGRIGNMLISYRCVSLDERSLAIGLHVLLLSALAFLPAPIVFGRIIDSVCLVWGGSGCGKKGNCMLYDGENLRYMFNLTAACFTFMGALCDTAVWYLSKDLDLYKEPEPTKKNEAAGEKSKNGDSLKS